MPDKEPKQFSQALEDHSAEGIAILTSEPSDLIRATIWLMAALVIAALLWSFIGRSDVIVVANGTLAPEGEVRRIYVPIGGELVDIYVTEGEPVSEGDVIARLNARGAIEAATRALDAELKLAEAERAMQRFAGWQALKQREADSVKRQIEIEQTAHEKRVSEGLEKFAEAQKARLEEARGNLDLAARDLDKARKEMEKYQRLFKVPGGGGVSRDDVEERKQSYVAAKTRHEILRAKLGELDFELSNEMAKFKENLEGSDQKLIQLQIRYDALMDEIRQEENRLKIGLRSAQLVANTAARIDFENIDEDNFLLVVAPVSGIVTNLSFNQPGDKIESSTPLGAIAPGDAQRVLKVQIKERDRGFLRQGQSVKMKFNAFPYQRYGFIEGALEYISPATESSPDTGEPIYKAHASLDRDNFEVDGREYPLRFGMVATAEIVVRKRRLIDLALDPFRNL